MKLFQAAVIVAAAVVVLAPMASAQSMVEGQVVEVIPHCSGGTPDTCGGILQVGTGVGSFGSVTDVYVPEGTMLTFGNRRVPITDLAVGDLVRIDYTTPTTTNVGAMNTVSSGTVIERAGSSTHFGPASPATHNNGE
jgi:hypothetical protein